MYWVVGFNCESLGFSDGFNSGDSAKLLYSLRFGLGNWRHKRVVISVIQVSWMMKSKEKRGDCVVCKPS